MANRQRLMSNIPGVLDSTADTVGVLVLQLQGASAKEDLSDENETADRDTLPSREAADKAICDASEDLKGLLNLHEHHPDLHIADSVLCHGRLRNALLQLLVLTMRWELLRYRTAQPYTAALATEQRPIVSAAEEGDGTQRTALPLCGTAVSCRHVVLSIMSSMLKAGAEQLTRSNPNRSGTGSRGVRCLGRRRAGAASASNLEPGGLTASNGHPLSLLDLELGCTLLRTNTLQCCSVQLAAVCAWMGGDGEKQQQQQQQRQPFQEEDEQQQQQQQQVEQQSSHRREQEEQQQGTGEGAEGGTGPGQEQGCKEGATAGEVLDVVRASLTLVDGLLALAHAAVGVLGTAEGATCAMGAATAAQRADLRRLSRRFLLLFASHLRDSHLLEHCARAAVMAAVGGRVVGAAGGSGEAAEGAGQGQGQRQGQGSQRTLSDAGADVLHGLLQDYFWSVSEARELVKLCMQAPAPASTVIGPAVRQALTGPAVVHLDLVLGLHALSRADGGPEYGMPVSYRVLPAVWKPGRAVDGHWGLFTADFQVMGLVDALRRPELRERLYELLGGVGPMLTLQLRVCELTTRSAEVHGQGAGEDGEERSGEEGVRGVAGGTLRYATTPEAAVGIGFDAHLAVHWLLGECWEQQEQQRESAAREPGGSGGREAAGAGSSSQVASQAPKALVAQEAAGRDEGLAAGEDGRERAGIGPQEAAQAGPGGVREREWPDATAVSARVHPGGVAGAAAVAPTAGASGEDVAGGARSGEPGGAAGAATAMPAAAVQAAGAFPRADGQVSGPGQRSRRPLSLRALRAFEVRWWRSVCRVAEHMVPLRLGPEEAETVHALRRNLVGWLRMEELRLPNPIEGPLPPTPPARLAAALDGGLLPCLERLMRRAARDPEGSSGRLVPKVLSRTDPADDTVGEWHGLLLLFAYGEEGQSMRVLSALAALLPRLGGSGGASTSRRASRAGPNEREISYLQMFAMTAVCALLDNGFALWAQRDPPEGGSGGSDSGGNNGSGGNDSSGGSDGSGSGDSNGGSSPHATCSTPGVLPPGRRRLQHMLAHAARLMLPPLARVVCFHCSGTDRGQQGRATASSPSATQRAATWAAGFVAAASGPMLSWIWSLSLMGLDGSCGGGGGDSNIDIGGGSGSGGGSDGGGGGGSDGDDGSGGGGGDGSGGRGSGIGGGSGSTGGSASQSGWDAVGDAGCGPARAASQEQQQQQQHGLEDDALRAVHDTALRRFLFEDVQAVEVLGSVLHHLHSLTAFAARGPELARALFYLTGAYPEELRRRVRGAAEGCKAGGRSDSSSVRGGRGARKQRGASGAGAGCSSQPDSVWPVELVRGMGAQAKGDEAKGLLAHMDLLAGLLEVWRGCGTEGEEGGGSRKYSQLRPAFARMDDMRESSASMTRVLYEVLSAPAALLGA